MTLAPFRSVLPASVVALALAIPSPVEAQGNPASPATTGDTVPRVLSPALPPRAEPSAGTPDARQAPVDEQPQLLNLGEVARLLSAIYPPALREAGVEGRVVVRFIVRPDGSPDVGSMAVVQATDGEFVQLVRSMLPRLRFRPARRGSVPVAAWVVAPFRFVVEE